MAIDADGSVVVAGGRRPATGNLRAVLARFTPAGALDTGFDTDGWRDVPIRTTSDLAYGVVIANDGSIVVAGLGIRVSQFSSDGTTVSAVHLDARRHPGRHAAGQADRRQDRRQR